MPAFLLGLVALLLVLWAASAFIKADPKEVARVLRWIGGGAALLLAGFLLFRGAIAVAIPFGAFGLSLLGWASFWPALPFGARTQKSAGQVSRVRTAFFEMELDHDTGRMNGHVLADSYQGASLDALDRATLTKLMSEVDADSRDLLAAYLDRREPGWREYAQRDAGAGARPGGAGKMNEEEAYQILGLQPPGASMEEIRRAHRSLIKKLHPDQGGTTYLAARINEAKDVLLRRHSR
jgi:hypothetical protein